MLLNAYCSLCANLQPFPKILIPLRHNPCLPPKAWVTMYRKYHYSLNLPVSVMRNSFSLVLLTSAFIIPCSGTSNKNNTLRKKAMHWQSS